MKIRFVQWDWKESPDMIWFNEALRDVFNGSNTPCVSEVNTGADLFAVVISAEVINTQQAEAIWERYTELPDEEHPNNKVLDIEWPTK